MEKVIIYLHALFWYIKTKMLHGGKLKCQILNGIKGSFKVHIAKKSRIVITGKIYSDGPIYLNASNGGTLKIMGGATSIGMCV